MLTPTPLRRVAAACAAALVATLATVAAGAAPAPAATAPAPSSTHPYSAPTYYPLRAPARISCVKTNCTEYGLYHQYWAVDFLGAKGDPVHPAGAGIFHIGGTRTGCVSRVADIHAGTWGWVDHGGGVITKYNHLSAILAKEGQRVTPATVIGRMGSTGDMYPCTTNYLHYEVRTGGVTGTRVNPGSLIACLPAGPTRLPQLFGATSFNDLAPRKHTVPPSTSSCVGDPWNHTPAAPRVTARPGNGTATLTWPKVAGATVLTLTVELWSPSVHRWNKAVTYVTLPGAATRHTVTKLANGRTYRFTLAAKGHAGSSAWSTPRTAIPAAAPAAPKAPRFLTSPHPSYIHYGWWKSAHRGTPATGYTTQVRCQKKGKYTPWSSKKVRASTFYYDHRGLTGTSVCQVRVRAESVAGPSSWSKVSTLRKRA